jgi:phosphatidylinositol alpha-mannosyltransferase
MKVLFVSDIYYPHIGGISEHIYHLANEFESMGHAVSILTANMEGDLRPDEERVIRIGRSIIVPANRSYSRITYGLDSNVLFRVVNKFDVVHIHGTLTPTFPLSTLKVSRRTNIFTFHSTFEYSVFFNIFKGYLNNYFKHIDGKIAVSMTARDSIARYLPGDYRIIPNGVDNSRFTPGDPHYKSFNEILFVGRIEPRKGLQFLIDAFPKVKKEIPEAKLTIAGGGYKKIKLNIPLEVKDSIKFLNFVAPKDLPQIFRRASLFISPAITGESFGIVLLEAMASGTPVIASDIPGYRCVIEDEKNGLLVPPGNPAGIARTIIRVLNDNNLRNSLIEEGFKSAERYSWDKVSREVLAFYYEIDPSLS